MFQAASGDRAGPATADAEIGSSEETAITEITR
jgi:hypothetical protein